MFIERLNENEKKDFLELIYKIANCDNNFADEEEELINSYKNELGLSLIHISAPEYPHCNRSVYSRHFLSESSHNGRDISSAPV